MEDVHMRQRFTVDAELILSDVGLVTATGNGTVGGAARVVDLGSGRCEGHWITDISAIEVDTNNELYQFILQGCNLEAFTSGTRALARLHVGAFEVVEGEDVDSEVERYVLPFTNVVGGESYRYARVRLVAAGTIVTGINYTSYLTKLGYP